ncbi:MULTISPECIES: MATE family efflux transporter [unclassified Sphingobacterium]|uniref:MATE family efflux transporter n=1 Tax=unclassified Sphingobacterium TaxID=2609468 RepID=UPI00104ABC9C|nr:MULTISPECIES: MATE family efflux transporter [unclassified Sphingobacterium]MCS3556584.1 putative MATE family efflux protein [Sphingobacterium sp. JUb21]
MLFKIKAFIDLFWLSLRGTEQNFTSGNVNRATFLLAIPTMLELALESLFVIVDLLFVSSLGEKAITIVGINNTVLILMQSIATGLSIAAIAMISRRIGQQKPSEAALIAIQIIFIGLLIGGTCSVITSLFSEEIIRFSGASVQLAAYGWLYTKITFAGAFLVIMRIILNGIFRGAGDPSRAMRALLIANALNLILCALLIYGFGPIPAFGIIGVGIAMIVSNTVVIGYQIWHLLFNNKRFTITKQQFQIVPALIRQILKLGSAGTMQFLIPSSSRFLMIIIVAKLGESTLAGYILANRIIMFTVLPAWGIANAAAVLTGQNLGASQPERAEESVWKTGRANLYYLGLMAIFLFFYGNHLATIFTKDPVVLNNTYTYLKYMAVAYFFFGYTMVISRSLNASGAVNTVTLLNVLMFYIVQLPLAYLLAIKLDLKSTGIFIAITISEIVLATACVLVFKKGTWKKIKI